MTALPLARRYLDLLELVLTGALMEDPPLQTERHRDFMAAMGREIFGPEAEPSSATFGYHAAMRETGWDWPSRALTMVGRRRLHNFRTCIEDAIAQETPGDIVETGVWRGGASILARAVLAAHAVTDRRVILADSFAGLPPPDPRFPADQDSDLHTHPELAVPLHQVRANFAKFDLLDRQVVFVAGWFRDTMPTLDTQRIAVLRLDGDMYESTIDPLQHLYDRVSPGGWVIVDDYGVVAACRAAVHDFLDARALAPAIVDIDGMGAFFRKSE